jgi:peroxiredoxin
LKLNNILAVHNIKPVHPIFILLMFVFLVGCSQPQVNSTISDSSNSISASPQPAPAQEIILEEEPSPDLAAEVEGYASSKLNSSSEEEATRFSEPSSLSEEGNSGETLSENPGSKEEAASFSLAEQPPVAPEIGATAPDFELKTLDGRQIRLSELNGRPVLVSYWVTWCIPCMEELPVLDRLSEEFPGLEILTINGVDQDDITAINQKVTELQLGLPVLLDENKSFWQDFRVLFLPTSFFIDQHGVIRHIQLGSLSEADLRQKISLLIDGNL